MKKLEISELGLKSLFKVTMYVMIIPMALFFLLGAVITAVGAIIRQPEALIVGIIYMIFPVFLLPFYGAINALIGLLYNVFSKRFGGLEITIKETESEQFPFKQL